MARNIKIELELPEFEKELVVSVTLKRDGEVVSATSTAMPDGVLQPVTRQTVTNDSGGAWKQQAPSAPWGSVTTSTGDGGPSAILPEVGQAVPVTATVEAGVAPATKKRGSKKETGNMMDMSF